MCNASGARTRAELLGGSTGHSKRYRRLWATLKRFPKIFSVVCRAFFGGSCPSRMKRRMFLYEAADLEIYFDASRTMRYRALPACRCSSASLTSDRPNDSVTGAMSCLAQKSSIRAVVAGLPRGDAEICF